MLTNKNRLLDILTEAAENERRATNPLTGSEVKHQANMRRFYDSFGEKRKEIIVPVIESMAVTIRDHGHDIAIIEDVPDEETPRIEVRLTPRFWGDRNPSKFCVSADPRRQTVQFWNNEFSSSRYPIEYITTELVEHHFLDYISTVFEHLYDK